MISRCLSAAGICFLNDPMPAGELGFVCTQLTFTKDSIGFTTFHWLKMRRVRRSIYSGGWGDCIRATLARIPVHRVSRHFPRSGLVFYEAYSNSLTFAVPTFPVVGFPGGSDRPLQLPGGFAQFVTDPARAGREWSQSQAHQVSSLKPPELLPATSCRTASKKSSAPNSGEATRNRHQNWQIWGLKIGWQAVTGQAN